MEVFVLVILSLTVLWLIADRKAPPAEQAPPEDLAKILQRLDHIEQRMTQVEKRQAGASEPVPAPRPTPPAPEPIVRATLTPPEVVHKVAPPKPADFGFKPLPPASRPTPPAPSPVVAPAPTPRERSISLEERLGRNWLSKLGIVAVVIGVAGFLGRELLTLGPRGKSLLGFTLGVVILVGSLFLERRERYRIFARAGIGGGWALIFFVVFAMYHVTAMQIFTSQALDLTLMLIVAAGMVVHSLHYKSQVVTSLAFLLAFVTVGISHVTLFSLVAGTLLALGLVYVVARESWFELALAGLFGVYFNHFLWLMRVLPDGGQPGEHFPEFFASADLLLLYWLIFRLLYVLRFPRTQRQESAASLGAIFNTGCLLGLLKYQSSHPEWACYGLLALGTLEMAFAFVARRRARTPFIVLASLGSILMVAAIPFRFNGSSWTLAWLFEAELLFFTGVRIRESVFRRLGLIASFAVALQILLGDVLPVVNFRQEYPDTDHHWHLVVALLTTAILFWFNSEFTTRRWNEFLDETFDPVALRLTSFAAFLAFATALWVAVPGAWTIVVWLLAMLMLGLITDALDSGDLATQTDLLAAFAVLRAFVINLDATGSWHAVSIRAITIGVASVLLYVGIRRKTHSPLLPEGYVATVYSWSASAPVATLIWYELPPLAIAVAWAGFGLILFECGTIARRGFLRHQAYVLFIASFIRIFFANLYPTAPTHLAHPRLYTVIPLIAAYLWVYERIHRRHQDSDLDVGAGMAFAWIGLIADVALLHAETAPDKLIIPGAALTLVLLAVGWLLGRTLFVAQSLCMLTAVFVRAVAVNLMLTPVPTRWLWNSRLLYVCATCGIVLLALPIAFRIRKLSAKPEEPSGPEWLVVHPEQPFFFVPLLLGFALITMEQTGGRITIGWSSLGVLVFLFALLVGERSYRLSGLGLVLLGVGKIVLVDIWTAAPIERYITLIVTGAALLLVSFLYSRYRETIMKLL